MYEKVWEHIGLAPFEPNFQVEFLEAPESDSE